MKVFAGLLIVIGVLVAGLSGMCTLTVSLFAFDPTQGNGPMTGLPLIIMALIIGVPFIAGGVGLVLGGRSLWKRREKDRGGSGPP